MSERKPPTCVHGVPYDRPCTDCNKADACPHGFPWEVPCPKCAAEDNKSNE